jgi:hypothetical protein
MDELDPPKQKPHLVNLIAWLSVCMLAAAWGGTLDGRWQFVWAQFGAFGLAAAVGLKTLERARIRREKVVHDLISCTNSNGRLARLNQRSAAIEVIDHAIRRLTQHAVAERQRQARIPARGKRQPPLSQFPLQVIPVADDDDAFDMGSAHAIGGSLRTLSSRVVCFQHDQAFTEHVALLSFKLGTREQLCFVVDVVWTKVFNDGFVSSGAVMAVGVHGEHVSKNVLVDTGQRT